MLVQVNCVLFFLVLLVRQVYTFHEYESNIKTCGRVHLTISSLEDTFVELNWITKCDDPDSIKPHEIALYDNNPLDRNEEVPPRVLISASKYPEGYYRTKIKFGEPWLPGNWEYNEHLLRADPGPHCFPYWIASLKNGFIIDVRCLQINPTWMSDNSKRLGPLMIGNLFIPGTHNSGTSKTAAFLQNYVMNQDKSVWTQLVFGIRYLDIRVGYYGTNGFSINHDVVRISKLVPILREIRKFVELAPRELIVLDFHRFPYPSEFTLEIHQKLVSLINDELGDLALSSIGYQSGRGPTLNEIWSRNKSLIICYGNRDIARGYDWLWNPVQQLWGNKRSASDLYEYLDNAIGSHKTALNPLWAVMAELTPQTIDVIFRTNNLRKLSDNVNKQVTKWFRDEWAANVNIVATDFFLGNDIINIAIDRNLRKGVFTF